MIEVLTVTAILAILIIMAITMLPRQLEKARDSERKSDLQKIKVAFENYYNDNGCYPSLVDANGTPIVLQNCGGVSPASHELSPYLQNIPCDPQNEKYYLYAPYDNTGGSGTCDGFRVWANLEKDDDPVITALHCESASGCGAFDIFGGPPENLGAEASEYNYGVSEGVPVFTGDPDTYLDNGFCCAGVCNAWSSGSGACADEPYGSYDECVASSACSS